MYVYWQWLLDCLIHKESRELQENVSASEVEIIFAYALINCFCLLNTSNYETFKFSSDNYMKYLKIRINVECFINIIHIIEEWGENDFNYSTKVWKS